MTRRRLLAALPAALAAAPARRPNVIFILADDLGWSDTGVYGSTLYETPNIDRLAARGMRFTQAYAACPLCSPTRASILTGQWPARLGITSPAAHLPQVVLDQTIQEKAPATQRALAANTKTRLATEYFTLAEAFREAGYATGHFGKWHLGRDPYDPKHQGFDVDLPHTPGPGPGGGYLGPWSFWPGAGQKGEHIEDRMSAEAVRFIQARRDQPFYLSYWAFSVHSPWQAKADLIEKYRTRVKPDAPQKNPMYAAMVESLDQAVGKLIDAVDAAGLREQTIFVFFSDNGGVHWPLDQAGLMHPEFKGMPATSNAPLRGGKATLYEGGTREPCVVVWPGHTKPGAVSRELVQSIDFYPTLLGMAGLQPQAGLTLDGVDIRPALAGRRLKRDLLFCHFPHYTPLTGNTPGTWVRQGDWKLIRFYCENPDQTDKLELYHLARDVGETRDLAAAEPKRTLAMNALIDGFLKRTKAAVPRANPAYRA